MGIVSPPSVSPRCLTPVPWDDSHIFNFVCTWVYLWTFRFVDLFVCFSTTPHSFQPFSVAVHLIPDQWVVNESHFQIFLCYLSLLFSSWTSKSWRQVSRKFHLRFSWCPNRLCKLFERRASFQKCTFSFWAALPVCCMSLILRHHQVWATSLIR